VTLQNGEEGRRLLPHRPPAEAHDPDVRAPVGYGQLAKILIEGDEDAPLLKGESEDRGGRSLRPPIVDVPSIVPGRRQRRPHRPGDTGVQQQSQPS
jgi:hypothetical protein